MNKPKCKLTGKDGNIFSLLAEANHVLLKAGMEKEAKGMQKKVYGCVSFSEALMVIGSYVEIE